MLLRWLRFLLPAPGPLSLLAGAGVILGLGLLAAVGYALSQTGLFLENFGFMYGLFCVPPAAVSLAAAALWERQPLPRAGLWLGAGLVLALGGLLAALAIAASPEAGLAAGLTTYALICVPPAVGSALIGLYFAGKGTPAARAALREERAARALHMLEARGEVSLAELAAELGAPVGDCDQLVESLLRGGRLAGFFDAPRGRVYTQAALRAKQKQLIAVVQARGQVSFDDLAAELRAPRELLRAWVYEAVRRGEFTGYLNWSEGLLYSADAAKLRASDRCPRCGGELALAGQGVIQCGHCGAEVFLASPADDALEAWGQALNRDPQARAFYEQLDSNGQRVAEAWVSGAPRGDLRSVRLQAALRYLSSKRDLRGVLAAPFWRELFHLYGPPQILRSPAPEALAQAQAEQRVLYVYEPGPEQDRRVARLRFRPEPEPGGAPALAVVFPPPFTATAEALRWLSYNPWMTASSLSHYLAELEDEIKATRR